MSKLDSVLRELVTANRILAREGIVDSFGHVSVRHPDNPNHFFMSRARAPDCVDVSDLMEFTLEGQLISKDERKPYLERFIHGSILEARPEINSVVHNHSNSVIPFGATNTKIRPVMHMIGNVGHEVEIWDSADKFGDTDMLISSLEMGRDLAKGLGKNPTVLMRGHGCVAVGPNIRHAVFIANYLEIGAVLHMDALKLAKDIHVLSKGEVDKIRGRTGPYTVNRAWENWCRRAGQPVPVEE